MMKSHFIACSKKIGDCSTFEEASAAKQPRLYESTLQVSSSGHTEQQEIDASITKFDVETNSPFVIVENVIFRRLVYILRLGTKIPSRHTIAGPLHDRDFAEEKLKVENIVKDQFCTMMIDGWSTRSWNMCWDLHSAIWDKLFCLIIWIQAATRTQPNILTYLNFSSLLAKPYMKCKAVSLDNDIRYGTNYIRYIRKITGAIC